MLTDAKKVVEQLSDDERRALRVYLDELERRPRRGATPEERIRRMDAAAVAIRAGMTQAELEEMTAAMNAEYVESADDDLWKA